MDLKLLMTVFGTVFLAELADKTQLATLLFASNAQHEKITAIAVTIGSALSHWIPPKYMSYIAGILFIGIGIWILVKA
ncbi:MAG: TMEM165/GDT1 family protein [Deltaproteobacteria bacterium]|nr:TMEM165/GDT1 family protein [Deltaproteobacteria bacterium]